MTPAISGLRDLTLDELFDNLGGCQPGAVSHGTYEAEIGRRKAIQDAEVAAAQIRAANAQAIAATWTKNSVAVGAVSAAITAAGLLVGLHVL
jgi:hypothetical protein